MIGRVPDVLLELFAGVEDAIAIVAFEVRMGLAVVLGPRPRSAKRMYWLDWIVYLGCILNTDIADAAAILAVYLFSRLFHVLSTIRNELSAMRHRS